MSITGGTGIDAANYVRDQKGQPPLTSSVTVASVSRDTDSKRARGATSKLEENQYQSKDLRYPLDLGTNNFERLHHITFFINVQNKSGYTVTEETNAVNMSEDELRLFLQGGGGETGQANVNRFSDKGGAEQLSSGTGVNGTTIAAGGSIFGAGGATIGAKVGAALGGLRGALVGAGGGFIGGAGIGTAIVSAIDLSRKTKRIKSSISLYMPDTVNQQIIHEFGEISMTEALGMVGAVGQGLGAVGSSISDAVSRISQNQSLKGAGAPAGAALAELGGTIAEASGVFGGGIKEALLFSAGVALNPQIEVLYQKTGHREFLFDFKMVPRNEAEAGVIRDIIKEFKFYSAPELLAGTSGRYFVPPAEFDIKFFYNGAENRNIHRISTCALVGIDIDYAGAGQWTTFNDGMPVEIKMQLRFKELELMHKGRIEEGY